MEMLIGLAAIVLFGFPIAALIISLSMRSRVTSLQLLVDRLSAELSRLRTELAALRPTKEVASEMMPSPMKDRAATLVTPPVAASTEVRDPSSNAWGQPTADKVASEQASAQSSADADRPAIVSAQSAANTLANTAVPTATLAPAPVTVPMSAAPTMGQPTPTVPQQQPAKSPNKPVVKLVPPPKVESALQRKLKELLFGGNMVAKMG